MKALLNKLEHEGTSQDTWLKLSFISMLLKYS